MSNEHTERFGGPGSSHQDRAHPGQNGQETGHKGEHAKEGPPRVATNDKDSHVSGGGGEQDSAHAHK
jgi:hypothetical protein